MSVTDVQHKRNFSTAYVSVQVDNIKLHSLVDSGSSISIVCRSVLGSNSTLNPVDVNVTGITGKSLKIVGSKSINLSIGDFNQVVTVYVADNLNGHAFIIGRDILETFQCVLNYRKLTFSIGDCTIPLFKTSKSKLTERPFLLQCSKTVHIQPRSNVFVKCDLKIKKTISPRVHLSTTGTLESLLKVNHVTCENSLVNVCDGRTHVNVINNSDSHVTVRRSQNIATLDTFCDEEISLLNSNCINRESGKSCSAEHDPIKSHDSHCNERMSPATYDHMDLSCNTNDVTDNVTEHKVRWKKCK